MRGCTSSRMRRPYGGTFAVCQGCYGVEPTVFRNIPTVYTARSVLKTVSLLRSTVWYD